MVLFVQRIGFNQYQFTNFHSVYGNGTMKTIISISKQYKLPIVIWIKPLTYFYLQTRD